MKSVDNFAQLLTIKRYTHNTIKNYKHAVERFLAQLTISEEAVSAKEVQSYLYHQVEAKAISFSTQKQIVGAIKLFYKELYNRDLKIDYLYPDRREQKIPVVLSQSEVRALLETISNLKHQTIITCIYSAGLRISEAIGLQIGDVDSSRMVMTVRGAKGYKDREVMLSPKLLKLLRQYYKAYKPQKLLFEGQGGKSYSATSVRNVFK